MYRKAIPSGTLVSIKPTHSEAEHGLLWIVTSHEFDGGYIWYLCRSIATGTTYEFGDYNIEPAKGE